MLTPDNSDWRGFALALRAEQDKAARLDAVMRRINEGLLLDDIMEGIFRDFSVLIPFSRIGLSFLEEGDRVVRARWAKSARGAMKISRDYSAPLAGSSLAEVLATGRPRILNDLEDYLRQKPASQSTRLIVEEGFRSSLTCPLLTNGKPVGFLFFSSERAGAYTDVHVEDFQRIAANVSVLVEKGRLTAELAAREAAVKGQNEKLQKLNELKNIFLGVAAHDLRGPLSLIKKTSDVLLDPSSRLTDDMRRDFLTSLGREAAHLLALLNDLLDVTQIESGRFTLEPAALSAPEFLQEAVSRHGRLAAPKGTRVLLESAAPGHFHADPQRLRQVMDNLLSNAVKYSPAGATVTVRARREGSGWRVEVEDQGPGFTVQDRDNLFQDFARLSAKPTGGEKSTGLGLAITRRVVEAHGGAIGVVSVPGRGACFYFTLPAAPGKRGQGGPKGSPIKRPTQGPGAHP